MLDQSKNEINLFTKVKVNREIIMQDLFMLYAWSLIMCHLEI